MCSMYKMTVDGESSMMVSRLSIVVAAAAAKSA
jgi:hypothetical protein